MSEWKNESIQQTKYLEMCGREISKINGKYQTTVPQCSETKQGNKKQKQNENNKKLI